MWAFSIVYSIYVDESLDFVIYIIEGDIENGQILSINAEKSEFMY